MKFIRMFLLGIILLSVMGTSSTFVYAETTGGIVPCGKNTGENEDKSQACTICHLIKGIHNIVQKIVSLIVAAATVVIVVSGVIYIVSAGNPAMITLAKTAMKNALIGVIVVLTAFVMINFIVNTVFNNYNSNLKVEEGGLTGSRFGRMWNFEC